MTSFLCVHDVFRMDLATRVGPRHVNKTISALRVYCATAEGAVDGMYRKPLE